MVHVSWEETRVTEIFHHSLVTNNLRGAKEKFLDEDAASGYFLEG